MFVDEWKLSVSLATIQISPAAGGTLLRVSEQGMGSLLDRLGASLR
jgi:hypothetical protein